MRIDSSNIETQTPSATVLSNSQQQNANVLSSTVTSGANTALTKHSSNSGKSNERQSNQQQPGGSMQFKNKSKYAQLSELSRLHTDCSNDTGSGCECSDDELITKFQERYRDKSVESVANDTILDVNSAINLDKEYLNVSTSSSTKTGNSSDTSLKDSDRSAIESSEVSSFEDLGAVGGIAANPNASDADKWQIINNPWNVDDTASTSSIVTDEKIETNILTETTNLPNSINEQPQHNNSNMTSDNQRNDDEEDEEEEEEEKQKKQQEQQQQQKHEQTTNTIGDTFHSLHSIHQRPDLKTKLEKTFKSRHSKITRRQSDGIVYMATTSNSNRQINCQNLLEDLDTDENDADDDNNYGNSSNSDEKSWKRVKKSCHKCGKTKGDLKKYIARFRRQLETTTDFSETEIKKQLDAFLQFLESRSRNSFDSKDDETVMQSGESDADLLVQSPTQLIGEAIALGEIEIEDFDDDYDDEAGIHVYGSNDDTTSGHAPRKFFNLSTIEKKLVNHNSLFSQNVNDRNSFYFFTERTLID